jgi:hypothetical protein
VITTPNRRVISPGRETPLNPFHIREYDHREFTAFMRRYYPRSEVKGIFHARFLRLHDRLSGRNFSQWCLELPPRLERYFYRPLFIPLLSTRDFTVRDRSLEEALDFIGLGWKDMP